MSEEGLIVSSDVQKFVPSDLQSTYAEMPVDDRNSFTQIEEQWSYNERDFVIKTGTLLRQVQELVKHPGVREGLTFERWYTAHGLKKAVAYRCIAIANGYYRIKAENAPDEKLMLDNFLSLNQKVQEAIGRGKIDPAKETYLLHTDPSVRESPVWQHMVKEISEGKKVAKKQEDTIAELKELNRQLNSKLASSENQRANLAGKLQESDSNCHHLELQLEDEKSREPETVVVPPDDYDELAAEVQKSRDELTKKAQQIKKLERALKTSSSNGGNMSKYEKELKALQTQNNDLVDQIKKMTSQMNAKKERHDSHKQSYEKVATISSEWMDYIDSRLDVDQLLPAIGQLSSNELKQIGLVRVADSLFELSKRLRNEIAKEKPMSPKKIVQADFKESTRIRKRG